MRPLTILFVAFGVLSIARPAAADVPAKYRPAIQKALAWLVKHQNKDGSWSSRDKASDVACTALAGLALLMEGSTTTKGKHAENVNKAAGWIIRNCQDGADDGLIGARENIDQSGYMLGQSYALLFLASAYARAEKGDTKDLDARLARLRQREMEEILKRIVKFTVKAQSSTGGWFLTASRDGNDQDEAATTLAQILALRAAQQAGIQLPKETLPKAYAYLEKMTTPRGGIPFSSRNAGQAGMERPGLTIAAVASTFGSDQVKPALVKKWLEYCQFTLVTSESYARFHLALAMHSLGDKGYAKPLGTKNPPMVWSETRKILFDQVASSQARDGSWQFRDQNPSPVFGTAQSLIMLQLDNEQVPILQAGKKSDFDR